MFTVEFPTFRQLKKQTHEPQCEETYLLIYASNEDSNQAAHLHSLIRVFVVHMKKTLHPLLSSIRWLI